MSDIERTNTLEDLIEFHLEFLEAVSEEDRTLLPDYYFAGREIDVASVEEYQKQREQAEPGISARARIAYGRFVKVTQVPDTYCEFSEGTNNSETIHEIAKQLQGKVHDQRDVGTTFLVVRQYINDICYDKSSGRPVPKRQAKSLLESRLTKASELIHNPMTSLY